MRTSRISAAVLALAIAAACNQKQDPADQPATGKIADPVANPGAKPTTPAEPTPAKKLFVYVSPDPLGVNPFLLMGKAGIEAAAAKHGAEVKIFESEDPTTRRDNLRAAVEAGATLVAVLGFQFNDIMGELAEKHPAVDFLMVDQCVEERPKNLHCAVFREYEPSFLVGAEAASLSKKGRVGVIAAVDIPFMHRFTDGFAQGAKHVKPDIAVETRWVGGANPFSDPVRAKEQALALHAAGVDIVFSATAGGDLGVFEAAAEKDFRVMGVDVTHCRSAPGRMYDAALKHVDTAMVEIIGRIVAGEDALMASYGLKEGGGTLLGLADGDVAATQCLVAGEPEVVALLKGLRDDIISGKIALRDPMSAMQ
jgi:basic membrane protein A